MAFSIGQPFHDGEEKMHHLMKVPETDNPTSFMLTPQLAHSLSIAPLLAVGTLDSEKRPWTTIWGGQAPLSQSLGRSMIGMKTLVDRKNDPVVNALFGTDPDGELVREEGAGRMISGLTCYLEPRKRVKLYGRMIAGAAAPVDNEENVDIGQAQIQLVMKVEQSLGNCPKYLNCKTIRPASEAAKPSAETSTLTKEGLDLIHEADCFFVSSSNSEYDMDTNHRGGPKGFVRVQTNDAGESEIVWPEYSGNRLYQTLGNLLNTPRAGLVFPDFITGNVLYVTGTTEILIGPDAAAVLPRSNLAVKLTVTHARFVEKGLPFRGTPGEMSPYNPGVRLLARERALGVPDDSVRNAIKLLSSKSITPTISRFTFTLSNKETWKAGQWVAIDFSEELYSGYSHMRDDDPLSLNDDFLRTFTVSSPPAPRDKRSDDEFDITIRRVGAVTGYLFKLNPGRHTDISIRGFGGDFYFEQPEGSGKTPFVVGGIGITPLMAQLHALDIDRLVLFWTLNVEDIALAIDLLDSNPGLGKSMRLFLTGGNSPDPDQQKQISRIEEAGGTCTQRRLQKEDLALEEFGNKWYSCCGPALQKTLEGWLEGKQLITESFNF